MAYYAWGEIKHSDGVVIERGQKLDKKDLPGISDTDWQAMVEGGSIRDKPFPAHKEYQGSAIDFLRESLQEAQAVSPVDEEEAVRSLEEVEIQPTEETKTATKASTKVK